MLIGKKLHILTEKIVLHIVRNQYNLLIQKI